MRLCDWSNLIRTVFRNALTPETHYLEENRGCAMCGGGMGGVLTSNPPTNYLPMTGGPVNRGFRYRACIFHVSRNNPHSLTRKAVHLFFFSPETAFQGELFVTGGMDV